MSKMGEIRSANIIFEGGMMMLYQSGRLTNAAALVQGHVMAIPFDCYIHSININIDTAFTHASSKIDIGTLGTVGAYVLAYVTYNLGAVVVDVDMSAATVVSRRIPKNTLFSLSMESADTTGKLSASVVLVPYVLP